MKNIWLLALLAVWACPCPCSTLAQDHPLPIRRILVDPANLPPELQRQKELIRIERGRFEEAVRKAAAAIRAAKNPPQLLEARYRAQLEDGHLVGTAEWKIDNPNAVAGFLPFDPWNLALRQRPMLGKELAVIAEVSGKTPGVLTPAQGVQTLAFAWSARGEAKPDGFQFDLQAPAAPIAVLEIDLPPHLHLVGADSPPAEQGSLRRWQIVFGGQSYLGFRVQAVRDTGKPTLLTARQDAYYDVKPSRTEARFEFDVECFNGRVQELRLDCDPSLEPSAVTFRQQAVAWQLVIEANKRVLSVQLPEPFQGRGTLAVSCDAGVPSISSRRSFPLLRLEGAIPRKEVISVHVGPDICLTDWRFGDFQPQIQPLSEKETGETVALTRARRQGGDANQVPSARVARPNQVVAVQQQAWWRVQPEGSMLTVAMDWQVQAGLLLQMPVEIPADWQVQRVELSEQDMLDDWYVRHHGANQVLYVGLRRPALPQTPLLLTLHLRPARPSLDANQPHRLSFPRVVPQQVSRFRYDLAISVDQFQPRLRETTVAESLPRLGPDALWSGRRPDFYISFHGQEPGGILELEPVLVESASVREWKSESAVTLPRSHSLTSVAPAIVESAILSRYADRAGAIYSLYRCRIRGAAGENVRFRLPADSHFAAVQLNGRTLSDLVPGDGILTINLEARLTDLEIIWREQHGPWKQITTLSPEEYGWQGEIRVLQSRVYWFLPTGTMPLSCDWRKFGEIAGGRFPGLSQVSAFWNSVTQPRTRSSSWKDSPGLVRLAEEWRRWVEDHPATREERLGSLISQLENRLQDSGHVIIVDEIALISAGVDLNHLAPVRPEEFPWEPAGLTVVPAQSALLLTTSNRLAGFESQYQWSAVIDDAVTHGHDASGTFRTLASIRETGSRSPVPSQFALSFLPAAAAEGWEVWEWVGLGQPASHLICVQSGTCRFLGLMFAFLNLILIWRFRWHPQRLQWLTTSVLGGVLVLLWLPERLEWLALPATLVLAGVAAAWLIHRVARRRPPARPRRGDGETGRPADAGTNSLPVPLSPRLFVLLVGFATFGLAMPLLAQLAPPDDAAEARTVYLFPGAPDKSEPSFILSPQKIWSRLQDLGRDRGVALPSYALVDAEYTANVAPHRVTLEAGFQVEVMGDEKVSVALPIGNVRLQSALLDGAPVLVAPLRQLDGFQVEVQGKGRHAIHLNLETSPQTRGGYHEILSKIPRVASSRCTCRISGRVRAVQALNVYGGQWVREQGEETLVHADLGAVPELRLRWWPHSSEQTPLLVEEAYVWNLRLNEATLWGVLRFETSGSPVDTVRIQLPPGLEVKTVEVKAEAESPLRLRDWSRRAGTRDTALPELILSFRHPAAGRFRVHLELSARLEVLQAGVSSFQVGAAMSAAAMMNGVMWNGVMWNGVIHHLIPNPLSPHSLARLRLPLPRPLNADPQRGYLAYGVEEATIGDLQAPPGFRESQAEEFIAFWPPDFGRIDNLTGYYRFQGLSERNIRPRILATPVELSVRQHVELNVHPNQIDVTATANLKLTAGSVSVVRWRVPPDLRSLDVAGDDVLRWSRAAEQVEVWFKRPIGEQTQLTLYGWAPLQPNVSNRTRLELPQLQINEAQTSFTRLKLNSAHFGTARPGAPGLDRLHELVGPPASEQCLGEFLASSPGYRGVLDIFVVQPVFDVDMTTHVTRQKETLVSNTDIDCRVEQGALPSLVLRAAGNVAGLSEAAYRDWNVRGKTVARTRKNIAPSGEWLFEIDFEKPVFGRVELQLVGPLIGKSAEVKVLPVIHPQNARETKRWLHGLPTGVSLGTAPPVSPPLQGGAGGATHVDNRQPLGDAPLELIVKSSPAAQSPLQVYPDDYDTQFGDDGTILNKASYLVVPARRDRPGGVLKLRLPEEGKLLQATADGREVSSAFLGGSQLAIPLDPATGWSRVEVRWSITPQPPLVKGGRWGGESKQIEFTAPQLESQEPNSATWTLHVPRGLFVEEGQSGRLAAAARDLQRAQGRFRLLQLLVQSFQDGGARPSDEEIVRAQAEFYRAVQSAEQRVQLPGGSPLRVRIASLRTQNRDLLKDAHWEVLHRKGEEAALSFGPSVSGGRESAGDGSLTGGLTFPALSGEMGPPPTGAPVYFFLVQDAEPLTVELKSEQHFRMRQSLLWSIVLSLLAVAVPLVRETSRFLRRQAPDERVVANR